MPANHKKFYAKRLLEGLNTCCSYYGKVDHSGHDCNVDGLSHRSSRMAYALCKCNSCPVICENVPHKIYHENLIHGGLKCFISFMDGAIFLTEEGLVEHLASTYGSPKIFHKTFKTNYGRYAPRASFF